MDKQGLYEFLTKNYMDDLFNPEEYKACDFFDEEKFIGLKRDATNHLNIWHWTYAAYRNTVGNLYVY